MQNKFGKKCHNMDFISINILDIIDILLVALIMFNLYKLIRGTSAIFIFLGILVIYIVWVVVKALNMELLNMILGQVIGVGGIALVILFQQEIRRFLLMLGSRHFSKNNIFIRRFFSSTKKVKDARQEWIDQLVMACDNLSMSKTGALIVLARNDSVDSFTATGQLLDAKISRELLENIFFKNSPLHDGAVLIAGDRLVAARCVLPSTERTDIPSYLGTRHRAAIGTSEICDALIIVVSEETGAISLVERGDIARNIAAADLRLKLEDKIVK